MKRAQLQIEQVDSLRKLKLPDGWEVTRLDVSFSKKGYSGHFAAVDYDGLNNVFYVRTDKAIVYPTDESLVVEAIGVMRKANTVIRSVKASE
jgi:hypothetical protein